MLGNKNDCFIMLALYKIYATYLLFKGDVIRILYISNFIDLSWKMQYLREHIYVFVICMKSSYF